jgi:hypothetical protein
MKERLLVTGSSGLLGSAVLDELESTSVEVVPFDLVEGRKSRERGSSSQLVVERTPTYVSTASRARPTRRLAQPTIRIASPVETNATP